MGWLAAASGACNASGNNSASAVHVVVVIHGSFAIVILRDSALLNKRCLRLLVPNGTGQAAVAAAPHSAGCGDHTRARCVCELSARMSTGAVPLDVCNVPVKRRRKRAMT